MNTLLIIFLCVMIAIFIYKIVSHKKRAEKTLQITNDIKEKLARGRNDEDLEKIVSASELINNKGSIKSASKISSGIINKPIVNKPIVPQTKKAVNWTESTSYEDDVKNVDIDSLLLKNTDNSEEAKATNPPVVEISSNSEHKTFVLLVDDSMVVRKYVGDLLKKNNYELIIKNDGLEAYDYLKSLLNDKSRKPELIISDIEMPKMDGIQLIEAIRKEKQYNNTPVLVISGHAEKHLKLMENESIQGFIKKPFNDNDLLNQINYLINHG